MFLTFDMNLFFSVIFVFTFLNEKCFGTFWGCDYEQPFIMANFRNWREPEFGDVIDAAIIINDTRLTDVISRLYDTMGRVVGQNLYNRLDDVFRFYHAYGDSVKKKKTAYDYNSFEVYFRGYIPRHIRETGSFGLSVQVLDQVGRELSPNVFLATAYKDVDDEFVKDQQYRRDIKTFEHNHVAAIFKLYYAINNEVAYVVMDPGNALLFLVWEKNTEFYDSGEFYYRMLPNIEQVPLFGATHEVKDTPYIIHVRKWIDAESYFNILYYVEKSYCSGLGLTQKKGLLNPKRILEKRDQFGKLQARISINFIEPKPQYIIQNNSGEDKLPLSKIRNNDMRELIEKALVDFVPEEQIKYYKSKLGEAKSIAIDNTTFLGYCQRLLRGDGVYDYLILPK